MRFIPYSVYSAFGVENVLGQTPPEQRRTVDRAIDGYASLEIALYRVRFDGPHGKARMIMPQPPLDPPVADKAPNADV